MQEAICIIGVQAAGKTTAANKLKEEGYVVIASDDLRREYPGMASLDIFVIFYQRLLEALQCGKSVVCEATNLTFKARQFFFEAIRKYGGKVNKVALIINTPIDICKKNLEERNKSSYDMKFGPEVIDKYVRSFQMPTYTEGFDEIRMLNNNKNNHEFFNEKLTCAMKFKHNDKWHITETVEDHCNEIINLFMNDEESNKYFPDVQEFIRSVVWHDYGKYLTAMPNPNHPEYLTYRDHGPVGAWELASAVSNETLKDFYVPLIIASYHMTVCDMKQKTLDKRFSKEEQLKLLYFEKLDKQASDNTRAEYEKAHNINS